MHLPHPNIESSAKTHSSVKAIDNFGPYPKIGYGDNLWHHPQAMINVMPFPHTQTQNIYQNYAFRNPKTKQTIQLETKANAYLFQEYEILRVPQLGPRA